MKRYVLDSYSIISYFERDKGFDTIIDFLEKATVNEHELSMNIINWGEVYYIILWEQGNKEAGLFENNFDKLPVRLVCPDIDLIRRASLYKAHNSLSYADCIAAATANVNKGTLVTGDNEFIKLEKEISIKWI